MGEYWDFATASESGWDIDEERIPGSARVEWDFGDWLLVCTSPDENQAITKLLIPPIRQSRGDRQSQRRTSNRTIHPSAQALRILVHKH